MNSKVTASKKYIRSSFGSASSKLLRQNSEPLSIRVSPDSPTKDAVKKFEHRCSSPISSGTDLNESTCERDSVRSLLHSAPAGGRNSPSPVRTLRHQPSPPNSAGLRRKSIGRPTIRMLESLETSRIKAVKAVQTRNPSQYCDQITSPNDMKRFWCDVRDQISTELRQRCEAAPAPLVPTKSSFINLNFGQIIKLRQGAFRAKKTAANKIPAFKKPFNPKHKVKRIWDFYIGLLILYSAFIIPLRLGFNQEADEVTSYVERFFNACFWMDIAIAFNTGYLEEDKVIASRQRIVLKYLQSWFVVDLLAAFPFEWIAQHASQSNHGFMAAKLFKIIRLIRLAKAMKLAQLMKDVDPMLISVWNTMGKVIIICHFMCCIWYLVSCTSRVSEFNRMEDPSEEDATDIWTKCGNPNNILSMYLAGFYFILYTILTIGYGEIHADNAKERIVAIFIQVLGSMLFGLIISVTKKIIHILDPIQETAAENLQEFSEYISDRNLTFELQHKLKRHFNYYVFHKSVFDENELYKTLPSSLRFALAEEVNKGLLATLSFFNDNEKTVSKRAQLQLACCLKPMQADQRDCICEEGSIMTEMYIIVKGKVQGMLNDIVKGVIFVGTWGAGSDFGLPELIQETHCQINFFAASTCDMLWISENELHVAMDAYPSLHEFLEHRALTQSEAMKSALGSDLIEENEQFYKSVILFDNVAQQAKMHIKSGTLQAMNLRMLSRKFTTVALQTNRVHPGRRFAHVTHRSIMGRRTRMSFADLVLTVSSRMYMLRTWRFADGMLPAHDAAGKELKGVAEVDETILDLNSRYIIYPYQNWLVHWNFIILGLLVFSSIVYPVRVAFDLTHGWIQSMDMVIDPFFMVDILLKFRTAYEETGQNNVKVFVTVPKMIAKRYLFSWFIIDVMSSIPFNLIKGHHDMCALKLLRLIRLQTFSYVLHAFSARNSNDAKKQNRSVQLPFYFTEMLRVFAIIYFSAHLFACIWWEFSKGHADPSWWVRDGQDRSRSDVGKAYLASLYWAMTTMATVGYGDIHALNDYERMLSICIMLLGATMFGYVIGNVSALTRDPHDGQVRLTKHLQEAQEYLDDKQVSVQLRNTVKEHLRHYFSVRSAFNYERFMGKIPPVLRTEMIVEMHEDNMTKIAIFQQKDLSFKMRIMELLVPLKFSEGDQIFKATERPQGVFFVVRGKAQVYHEIENILGSIVQITMSVFQEGEMFGYLHYLLPGDESRYIRIGAQASTAVQCFLLRAVDIAYVSHQHPVLAADLGRALENVIWTQYRVEKQSQNLISGRKDQQDEAVITQQAKQVQIEQAHTKHRRASGQSSGVPIHYRRESKQKRASQQSPQPNQVYTRQGANPASEEDNVIQLGKYFNNKACQEEEQLTAAQAILAVKARTNTGENESQKEIRLDGSDSARRSTCARTLSRKISRGSSLSLKELHDVRRDSILGTGLRTTRPGNEGMDMFLMKALAHCAESNASSLSGQSLPNTKVDLLTEHFQSPMRLFTMASTFLAGTEKDEESKKLHLEDIDSPTNGGSALAMSEPCNQIFRFSGSQQNDVLMESVNLEHLLIP